MSAVDNELDALRLTFYEEAEERLAELEEQRMAILPSERPRVQKVIALQDDAGELLLKPYQSGRKRSGGELTD